MTLENKTKKENIQPWNNILGWDAREGRGRGEILRLLGETISIFQKF